MTELEIYTYDENIKPIRQIEFTILGNDEIRKMSSFDKNGLGIEKPDLYENLEPSKGGLLDPRLGTSDMKTICHTCGFNNVYCPGHFAHITLEQPIFHYLYLKHLTKILSCICIKCSKLLIDKNEEELIDMLKHKSGKNRMVDIRNIVKNVKYCQTDGCGSPVFKIKSETKKGTGAIIVRGELELNTSEEGNGSDSKKIKKDLTPDIIYNILKNISDEDCEIMGINPIKSRPEMMIHKIFPVPPVPVRPSARADFLESGTSEDDLTLKLADIIKANLRLRKQKEATNESVLKYTNELTHLLQYHAITYFDNDTISVPKSELKGKTIKSLSSRLKSKEGRIRSNLMGNDL